KQVAVLPIRIVAILRSAETARSTCAHTERKTMDDPISPARRTLLKAGAATLATPVAAAIAQPAAAGGHQEAKSFDLWVISDQHVGTDKAASEGIQHGLVGFRPPPVRAESLATALRQSEEGGAFGGLSFNWDIALNLGDYAGFWDAPEDEQGR